MKVIALALVVVLSGAPAFGQPSDHPIGGSVEKAAAAVAAEQGSHDGGHSGLFWPGVALGIAGIAIGVVAVTTARVEDNSTGNAPPSAYQACIAQKQDPIYATNSCDMLKAKNVKLLSAGGAIGAAGAVMMIAGSRANAEISPGTIRFSYRVRF